jgi:hypothetical protein
VASRNKGSAGRRGAYGLHLDGLDDPALVPAGEGWPTVRIERSIGRTTASEDAVGNRRARLLLRNGGEIVLERSPLRALFRVPFELGDAELVHPYLAPAAAAIGWWLGRESFHGGGLVVGGSAIGVFGDRHAGKSSLLAALAQGGEPVLSDDVLVVDRELATFTGPRTVDLRRGAAEHLGVGRPLGVVGARERWRVDLHPAVEPAPLRAWVALAWGTEPAVRPLRADERLRRLANLRAVQLPPADPGLLLRLAALPAWELSRPKEWRHLEATAALLEQAVTARR